MDSKLKEFLERTDPRVGIEENFNIQSNKYIDIEKYIAQENLRKAQLENDALDEVNKGEVQDREQRKQFAEMIFTFVSLYMGAVIFILLSSGARWVDFHLSDQVIITLITTTTANIIGILLIVVHYLFRKKK